MAVQKEREHLGRTSSELYGLCRGGGGLLADAPNLCVFQRILGIMLHLPDDPWPAPRLVDGVEHRSDRVREQGRARFLGLQLFVLEPFPTLEHVMVPGSAG